MGSIVEVNDAAQTTTGSSRHTACTESGHEIDGLEAAQHGGG